MAIDPTVRQRVGDELGKLVAAEGAAISSTPEMFGILMRRACPDDEAAVAALEKVVSGRIVAAMLEGEGGPEQVPVLADRLVQSTGMPEDDARWAIEAWWRALRPISEGPAKAWTDWNRLDVSASAGGLGGTNQRSIIQLMFVGVAGALGGAMWGVYVLSRGDGALIRPVAEAVEDFQGLMRAFSLFALGGVGGFGGGILGWIGGGGRGWTSTFGRLGLSACGAFAGAAGGGFVGLILLGLPGVMFGALAGGALGGFLGLLAAERVSI
jgi:hypothetical protein